MVFHNFFTPLRFAALLCALPMLASCAKKNDESSPPPANSNQAASLVKVKPVSSFTEALSEIAQGSLSCPPQEECPDSVGMLLSADKPGGFVAGSDSVAACTAVLISEDLALTNSHCIPSAVKLLPDLCKERVKLVLPKNALHAEESFSCAQLLGASERATAMSPDIALIRLDHKSKRQPLATERGGAENLSTLRSIKVNPDMKNLTGLIQTESCLSVTNSYRMPVYKDSSSPGITLANCHAIPGNSGSPLLNAAGNLVALTQADLPLSDAARTEWGKHLDSDGISSFAPLSLATSLRCLAVEPNEGWKWNAECISVTEQDVAMARPRIRQQLENSELLQGVRDLLAPFLAQAEFLNWDRQELETKALTRKETIRPVCLRRELVSKGDILNLRVPEFQLELRFNRFLQPTPTRVSLLSVQNQTYRVSEDLAGLIPNDGAGELIALESCKQTP